MNTTQRLNEFIDLERRRFEERHDNMFAFSFGEVLSYYQFLTIIEERHKKVEADYTENLKSKREILKSEGADEAQMASLVELYNQGVQFYMLLRLEAESFYIFAKIALDKIVHAIEFYFGQGRGLPLDSHDNLRKYILEYVSQKGIMLPDGFVVLVEKLKADVSDFRDYQIEHEKNPRTTRPILFDDVNGLRMVIAKINPKSRESGGIEMKHIRELKRDIEKHIENTIKLIEENWGKTALTLKNKDKTYQG